MILSASRRTDIPAFFSDWFINRINEGFIYVKNPVNRKQISKLILTKESIDCIVFWTKNPSPIISKLNILKNIPYYFQFTITPYDTTIEPNVPNKNLLINEFRKLSGLIGSQRVIWRYDPIFFTPIFNVDYHVKYFEQIAGKLKGYTDKCIISIFDEYRNCEKNMRNTGYSLGEKNVILSLMEKLAIIAKSNKITLETCAENLDLSHYEIRKGKCIDDKLIERITGVKIKPEKDKYQRLECGCISSVDIGAYDSCPHNCLYCYANVNKNIVARNFENHIATSPLLIGNLLGDEKITEKMLISRFASKNEIQENLFDYSD